MQLCLNKRRKQEVCYTDRRRAVLIRPVVVNIFAQRTVAATNRGSVVATQHAIHGVSGVESASAVRSASTVQSGAAFIGHR